MVFPAVLVEEKGCRVPLSGVLRFGLMLDPLHVMDLHLRGFLKSWKGNQCRIVDVSASDNREEKVLITL